MYRSTTILSTPFPFMADTPFASLQCKYRWGNQLVIILLTISRRTVESTEFLRSPAILAATWTLKHFFYMQVSKEQTTAGHTVPPRTGTKRTKQVLQPYKNCTCGACDPSPKPRLPTGTRRMKVYYRHINYEPRALIVLQGQWLEETGFAMGDHILVATENGKLTITLEKKPD